MAAMASTIGTARGSTQGSWRPRALSVGVYAVHIYGMLLHEYGGHRLESYAEVDVLSVTDAALNTAGVVGMRFDASVVIKEHVVLFGTFHLQTLESFAVFKCLCGIDTEHAGSKG